jgi:initiation of chromosome replication (DNA synthesis)
MKDKLINVLKTRMIYYPLYLYRYRIELDLSDSNFIFLTYLMNFGDKFSFDLERFSKDLNIEPEEVFERIESLRKSKFIEISTIEKEKKLKEEEITLLPLYKKISDIIISEEDDKENEEELLTDIEKSFGRTLSPIEVDFIMNWNKKGYSNEIILSAIKETILNGANNLKYADKILFEWNKKGIKTVDDVEKDKLEFRLGNVKSDEIYDYDWLNE